jgi:LacI family transcriptional regulator
VSGRPTIHDVAREAGVSTTTASRALNNKGELRAETRERILTVAQRLQFVPNSLAQALVVGKTQTLGVLITDNTSPVYAELLRGIEEVANETGRGLLFGNSADSQEQALSWLATVNAKHVDGILLTPVQTDRRDIEQLRRCGTPFVLLLRYFADLPTDYVIVDNVEAGYLVTDHLLGRGHLRIGHLGGPTQVSTAQDRLAGYRRALRERGVPVDEGLIASAPFTIAGGFEAARCLLDRPDRPTAIFASTDLQAMGAFKAARQSGLRVPDDLALSGGDDIEFAEFFEVPLTSFHSPAREIGRQSARLLIARLDGAELPPQQVVLKPNLVVRRSSG